MGATLAAGFYKFIKYLEFETVLGPEDGEAPARGTNTNPATQGPSMLGGGQPSMLDSSGPGLSNANATDSEVRPVKGSMMLANQGAGLGDLLTVGDSEAVSIVESLCRRLELI